jgi:CubicO group peptidase (beta-lactamase class C family)
MPNYHRPVTTTATRSRPAAIPEPGSRGTGGRLELAPAFEAAHRAVRDGLLPSAVVAVADAEGTLGLRAFPGPADRGVRPDSVYFLASVTKPIVATAVMQLVDEGRLDLHAPIRRLVPEFRGPGRDAVTPWHVLTHTSGIPDLDIREVLRQRPTAAQMLARVCSVPLAFAPGARYAYASDSFYLLAAAISRLTGLPFPEALRRRVLDRVGAADVTFDPRGKRGRVVRVHGVGVENRLLQEVVLRFLARAALPGGGLWGPAEDLLRFGRALLPGTAEPGPRLLSRAAITEMTREQTQGLHAVSDDGTLRDPRYALGWGKPHPGGLAPSVIGETSGPDVEHGPRVPASPGSFTHGGATGTRLWIDPERGLVFVFLTNQWGVQDDPMFEVLGEVYRAWDAVTAAPIASGPANAG